MEKVVISRYWNNPEILVTVTDKEISLSMNLAEYLSAVLEEAGNPAALLTKAALAKRINDASTLVLSRVKEASKQAL